MKLEQAITQRILELCKENNITPNKLATLAGLPSATIRCIFYGRSKNPGTRTLLNVCQGLNITLFDFFNSKLFKNYNLDSTDK